MFVYEMNYVPFLNSLIYQKIESEKLSGNKTIQGLDIIEVTFHVNCFATSFQNISYICKLSYLTNES